jgi:hypothetical protein
MNPAMLPVVQFHTVPARSHNHDDHLGLGGKRGNAGGGVKGRGFEFYPRGLHAAL